MAIFNENFIKQWWDRSGEAAIVSNSEKRQKEEAEKKAKENAAKDESHLKEHGIISQMEFDECFKIVRKAFMSVRKFIYSSTFKPSDYKNYYLLDKNDYIRLGYISLKEYYKTEDEEVWKAGEKDFNKLLKKLDKSINESISKKYANITFSFSDKMMGNVYFSLESTKPKDNKDKKKEDK